jgi:hypothetical protein
MSQATTEEVRLSQERRDAILTFVLDYFTGDQIVRRTLAHFAFIAEVFGVNAKVREMVGKTSSVQGRQDLCVSLALAALNLAVSDEPVEATDRQLERREARAAAKQFKAAVVAAKPAGAVAPAPDAAKTVRPYRSIHNRPISELSESQREHVRKMRRERIARWKAAKSS